MKRYQYIKPEAEVVAAKIEALLEEASWGVDGEHKPIDRDDPEEIFSKGNNPWENDDHDIWD